MTNVKTLTLLQLEAFAASISEPTYRGRQIYKWLYEKGATSFEEMTDLPADLRARLGEIASIGKITEVQRQVATDKTIKSLFELPSGRHVEAVLIPDFDDIGKAKRLTVCVSSQVGCAMGCHFCATGLMGFHENLSAGQIFDQAKFMDAVANEEFGRGITNVVYMGMGEPLQNYANVLKSTQLICDGIDLAPKRITVSTVGLARRIKQLADDEAPFNLAISLHAPTDAQRSAIMPVNRSEKTDIGALKEAVKYYHTLTGKRVTYEYCMFKDNNDSPTDAKNLAKIARWAPSKVNLIMYNPVEGTEFTSTDETTLNRFIAVLVEEDVRVTVRRSRGQDIDAACGQLAVQET